MSNDSGQSGSSKRILWVVLALVVVVGAGAGAIVLANRSDSGVANGPADAISTTTVIADGNTTSSTSGSATSVVATAVASTATTSAPATTVKVLTTKPPTPKPAVTPTVAPTVAPTAAPTLAVTSASSNYTTYPCGAAPQLTLKWTTTLADSVTIGIDNPGAFEQNLPASGSLDVPFAACPAGSVKYFFIAKKSNGDQITRTIVVTAGP